MKLTCTKSFIVSIDESRKIDQNPFHDVICNNPCHTIINSWLWLYLLPGQDSSDRKRHRL